MFKLKTMVVAIGLTAPLLAGAQTSADMLKELQALKAKVEQLEAQIKAQQQATQAKPQQGTVDPAEFNKTAVKVEALEDQFEAQGFKGLKISGMVDPAFIYNQRQNTAGFQLLNKDPYSYDASYFGMAMLDFQKEMENGTKFRLTLAPERGVGAVFNTGSIVHEATASIPLTNLQTRLIVGQIPDWSGYEFLPPTQNKLITHNLLFDFTLPTAYTGAGLEVTSGKWIYKGVLANMNASKKSAGNKTPVLAYRVDYSRGEFQGFGFAGVHGKATNFNDCVDADCTGFRDSRLDLFEFDAYFIRGDVTVQGQLSYGQQKKASVTPGVNLDTGETFLRDAKWWGASVLGAYKFTPRFEGIARFDFINNKKNGGGLLGYTVSDGRNGIGPGYAFNADTGAWELADADIGANRSALSLGMSYLFNQNVTFKGELRFDRANRAVFLDAKDGSYNKGNTLFGLSTVVSF
ncbi:MAG: DUF3138 family protein [Burkholderiaceae bacterium]